MTRVMSSLHVNRERFRAAAKGNYANATELADYLTRHGVPFRDAHAMTGKIVRHAMNRGVSLEELSLAEIATIAPQVQSDLSVHLTLDAALMRRNVIGGTSPQQVQRAIEQASAASNHRSQPRSVDTHIEVVPASIDHVDDICRMVDYWAVKGENLPRSREEITEAINSFGVALRDGKVIGCASLHVYSGTLAEIRSLGVDPESQGLGAGTRLVDFFLDCARRLHIQRVFVLTRAPEFFQHSGFRAAGMDALPEKVFKDCLKCSKREKCDEIAMMNELTP